MGQRRRNVEHVSDCRQSCLRARLLLGARKALASTCWTKLPWRPSVWANHVARLLVRAVQVENSCSVLCTPAYGNAYHVNITDGLSCGVEKVCIRTECRRQPSVTESDLCKSVHPNQASQASGYDECQFLCYVKNRRTPYRYCRPPGTACTKNSGRPGTCNVLGYCMSNV
ncbi:hypothetical protein MTO96_006096 [Rhipicephalus appendiculatus]